MPYRVAPGIPLVLIRGRDGRVRYHYQCGVDAGPYIPWASEKQAAWLLGLNMIEHVDAPEPTEIHDDRRANCAEPDQPTDADEDEQLDSPHPETSDSPDEPDTIPDEPDTIPDDQQPLSEHVRNGLNPDRIQDCLKAIDELGIPGPAGAPTVRETLRAAGYVFSNDLIAAAVRTRKLPSDHTS